MALEEEPEIENTPAPEQTAADLNSDEFDDDSSDNDGAKIEGSAENTSKNAGEAVVFTGLCKLSCLEGTAQFLPNAKSRTLDESLPYAAGCFKGLQRLVLSLPKKSIPLKKEVFRDNVETILNFVHQAKSYQVPPVLVCEAISCLGCCFWADMGPILVNSESRSTALETTYVLDILRETGEAPGNAWSIRASAFRCISRLAAECNEDFYKRHRTGQSMVDACKTALRDRKYWRVR